MNFIYFNTMLLFLNIGMMHLNINLGYSELAAFNSLVAGWCFGVIVAYRFRTR